MKPYEDMTREELIKALSTHENILLELKAHQIELETHNIELQESRRELEDSRNSYTLLYDFAPVGYCALDEKGLIKKINLTGAKILGIERARLPGMTFNMFVSKEDMGKFFSHLKKCKKQMDKVSTEVCLKEKDGHTTWVEMLTYPVNGSEEFIFQTVITDITERRQMYKELIENKECYHTVADFTYDWEYWATPDGSLPYVSPSCKRITGYEAEEFQQDPELLVRIVHTDDREQFSEHHHSVKSQPDRNYYEQDFRIFTRSGEERWIAHACQSVYGHKGEYLGHRSSNRDITERKQTENALTFLVQCGSTSQGKDFFESLARYLALTLEMDFICIDRLEGDGLTARTVAVWCDGNFEDNVSYALKDTPCGDVVGKNVCCFPANVCQFFPRDTVLQDLKAESYTGVTLWSHAGKPIGLIAVIGRKPLKNPSLAEAILKTVAVRAGGELERLEAEEALREREELFRTLATLAPIGIYLADPKGHCKYANPRWCEMAGLSLNESLGNGWIKGLHPEDREVVLSNWQKTVESEGHWRHDYRFQTGDGKVTWLYGLASPQRDATGRVVQYIGINIDMTEQKQAEKNLMESEEKFRSLSENSSDYIMRYDREYRHTYMNSAALKVGGHKASDLIGKTHRESGFPEYLCSLWEDKIQHVFETAEPSQVEFEWDSVNGTVFLDWRLTPEFDEKGCVCSVMGVSRDITELIRSRKILVESEKKYRDLLNNINSGIVLHDADSSIVLTNPRACELLGLTEEQMMGKKVTDPAWHFLREDNTLMPLHEFPVNQVILTGKNINNFVVGINCPLTEEVVWVLVNGFPVLDASGKVSQAVITFIDITDFRKSEQEQKKLQDQLAQAQKMESVGRLAGGVAHDFNNILGIIMGYAEVIMMDMEPDNPVCRNLQQILNASQRGADLVRQLLAFARKQTIMPQVLDLTNTVSSMLKMIRRIIGEDISLTLTSGANLWTVMVDPAQIDQILANLCVNARDAIKGVGKITIETKNVTIDDCASHIDFIPGDYVILSVSDNGCGMDKDIIEHIFEPFFTTKERGKGTGLGLATVYGIVKQNNGFINVYSERGAGTTFKIYLPRYSGNTDTTSEKGLIEVLTGGTETILIVEDEVMLLKPTEVILKKLGYTVMTAVTPYEAICMAKEHTGEIHLLITDVIMPEMNGSDLAKELLSLRPNIKCLFMSGYTSDVIAHHGILDKGMNFIQKPFSNKTLTQKVREVLEKK